MGGRFEYTVCQAQESRVTFVNGEWFGRYPFDANDPGASMESCPWVWDYLAEAGHDGWELVAVTQQAPPTALTQLFLKRA
jgi:hypothetical protein